MYLKKHDIDITHSFKVELTVTVTTFVVWYLRKPVDCYIADQEIPYSNVLLDLMLKASDPVHIIKAFFSDTFL
jgi:hypothetical protein